MHSTLTCLAALEKGFLCDFSLCKILTNSKNSRPEREELIKLKRELENNETVLQNLQESLEGKKWVKDEENFSRLLKLIVEDNVCSSLKHADLQDFALGQFPFMEDLMLFKKRRGDQTNDPSNETRCVADRPKVN